MLSRGKASERLPCKERANQRRLDVIKQNTTSLKLLSKTHCDGETGEKFDMLRI